MSYRRKYDLYLAADQIGYEVATIRDMRQVDSGRRLEQFAEGMGRGSNAGRRHVDLAWIGPGVRNELGNGLGRERRSDRHDVGVLANACDRCDVIDEIKVELFIERFIKSIRGADEEQSVAIRWRSHDH